MFLLTECTIFHYITCSKFYICLTKVSGCQCCYNGTGEAKSSVLSIFFELYVTSVGPAKQIIKTGLWDQECWDICGLWCEIWKDYLHRQEQMMVKSLLGVQLKEKKRKRSVSIWCLISKITNFWTLMNYLFTWKNLFYARQFEEQKFITFWID